MQYTPSTVRRLQRAGIRNAPDKAGRFGTWGGRYIPETLMSAVLDLHGQFLSCWRDEAFMQQWTRLLQDYVGRPSALYHATRLSQDLGAQIYLKREDLNHTGAHKINTTLGQGLLARTLGKKRVIAETGAGQHGVATATAAALLGLECDVYMGAVDVARQALNVKKMQMLGARVIAVESGTRTLKDATNEALRQWVARVDDTHYIIGSAVGPHPYPWMVRAFQSVIGFETLEQLRERGLEADIAVACVGGGSNSSGFFHPMIGSAIDIWAVEAGGLGVKPGQNGASLTYGSRGVLHGSMSMIIQTSHGQIQPAHSISAGLDYPGVGPELAYWYEQRALRPVTVDDETARQAVYYLNRLEGILPALESAHAIGALQQHRDRLSGKTVVVCISGRGDKDIDQLLAMDEGRAGH